MTQELKSDSAFAGSIPAIYDRFLGPLLFASYAGEVARRAAALAPRSVLETAAGTGIVTKALAEALPYCEIVATDLNQAMLDVAAEHVKATNVRYQAADALDLPFDDNSFDLIVCQFGVMFYPDRVKGNAEARRVLRDGGKYLAVIWDKLERNPGPNRIHEIVGSLFPDNPPLFLARTPWGYADQDAVRADLEAAGFRDIEIETVAAKGTVNSPRDAAMGLVAGSPLRAEIEERAPGGFDRIVDKVTAALDGDGDYDTSLSALVVTATR